MNSELVPESAQPSRILVVDDEPRNRELIRATLEIRGHVIEEAGSGTEALVRIAETAPDLVLLDVAMPGLDGLEVCRQLRRHPTTAALPVIMVTAQVDRRDRLAGIEAGANDYLLKPIDREDLVLRVRNAVAAKHLADEVRRNLERLQELERLRDGLTHMIVHDLRSPLGAVMLSMATVKEKVSDEGWSDEVRLLEMGLKSVDRMSDLVRTLLDVSRLEAGEMPLQRADTPLMPLIAEVIDSLETLAVEKKVRVIRPTSDAEVSCDPSLINRVVCNLLANALKFTPVGGEVAVRLEPEASGVRVVVRDNGPGIAPEYHGKIFDKFGQASPEQARIGTGLGLAFCRLAVEAHGGRIGVESVSGQGSTFWFTLPC